MNNKEFPNYEWKYQEPENARIGRIIYWLLMGPVLAMAIFGLIFVFTNF